MRRVSALAFPARWKEGDAAPQESSRGFSDAGGSYHAPHASEPHAKIALTLCHDAEYLPRRSRPSRLLRRRREDEREARSHTTPHASAQTGFILASRFRRRLGVRLGDVDDVDVAFGRHLRRGQEPVRGYPEEEPRLDGRGIRVSQPRRADRSPVRRVAGRAHHAERDRRRVVVVVAFRRRVQAFSQRDVLVRRRYRARRRRFDVRGVARRVPALGDVVKEAGDEAFL